MQFLMTLSKPSMALPINYRPLVHGVIYHALMADACYADRMHGLSMQGGSNRQYKGFTFSPLLGAYTIDGSTIWFHNQVSLEIRCWDAHMIRLLYDAFTKSSVMTLGTEELRVTRCEITDTRLETARARIRMLSPAVAYVTDDQGHTIYFQPDEDRFYYALIRNAERKNRHFQPDVPFDLRIRSLNNSLPRKQFSRFKKTYINGWVGSYLLEGRPQVIDLLYQVGLGAKNSEGFGMFALEEEPD